MSRKHWEEINCPACGHSREIIVWDSLNGDLDPEAKGQLMNGTLFTVECSGCGQRFNVHYNMLYHDMAHHAMVYHADAESAADARNALTGMKHASGTAMSGYRMRVVSDADELQEKAVIFENGLDDRVIEIIKLMFRTEAARKFPDYAPDGVYFTAEDGKYGMEFTGDEPLYAEMPEGMYEEIRDCYAGRLAAAGDELCTIDAEWALAFLKGGE